MDLTFLRPLGARGCWFQPWLFLHGKAVLAMREADDPGVVRVLSTWRRGYFFLTAQQSATATWPNAQKSSACAYFWCPRQGTYLLTALLKLLFYFWTSGGLQLLSCCELQVVNRSVRLLTPRAFCLFITYDHKRSLCLWLDPSSHESAFRNDCK